MDTQSNESFSSNEPSWKVSTNEQMLSLRINWKSAPDASQVLEKLVPEIYTTKHINESVTIDVTASGLMTRIDCIGHTWLGDDCSYLEHREEGFVFLDHPNKNFLHLPKSSKLSATLKDKEPVIKIHLANDNTDNNSLILDIQLDGVLLIYEMNLFKDKNLKPYTSQIIKSFLPCPGKIKAFQTACDKIKETGFPRSAKVFVVNKGQKKQLLTSYEVTDISVVQTNPGIFSIPSQYTELLTTLKVKFSKAKARRSGIEDTYIGSSQPYDDLGELVTQKYNDTFKNIPTCSDSVFASQIATLTDQKLLDDIKYGINAIFKRISKFESNDTYVTIDWLRQFENQYSEMRTSDPGSGLYPFLHRDDQRGLLDVLALKGIASLLASKTIEVRSFSGLFFLYDENAEDSLLLINEYLSTEIQNVLRNDEIERASRFDTLSESVRKELFQLYLFNRLGTWKVPFMEEKSKELLGLVNITLSDVDLTFRIRNEIVFRRLVIEDDGAIRYRLFIPKMEGTAKITRTPTAQGFAVMGATAGACILFPTLCATAALALSLEAFLLADISELWLEMEDIIVTGRIKYQPDADLVLQPSVTMSIDADINVFIMSVIPTGFHQLYSLLLDFGLLFADDLMNSLLSDTLRKSITNYLRYDLGLSYPKQFDDQPLQSILPPEVSSNPRDFLYMEAFLNAAVGLGSTPYITQVGILRRQNALEMRRKFLEIHRDPVAVFDQLGADTPTGDFFLYALSWLGNGNGYSTIARFYMSHIISQNFINHYLHSRWKKGVFTENFTERACYELSTLIPKLPENHLGGTVLEAHCWAASTPRIELKPVYSDNLESYAYTWFDDIRLCVSFKDDAKTAAFEIAFAAGAPCEIGFGVKDPETDKLDMLKITDKFLDIYFNIDDVTIINPEKQAYTYQGQRVSGNLDKSWLNELQQALFFTMRVLLRKNHSDQIPHRTTEAINIQRYPIGNDALHFKVTLRPHWGNLYVQKALAGVATGLLEGAFDIDIVSQDELEQAQIL